MSNSENIIPDEGLGIVREMRKNAETWKDDSKKKAESIEPKNREELLEKIIDLHDEVVQSQLASLCRFIEILIHTVNKLGHTVNQLAKKGEVDEVRTIAEEQKIKVQEYLLPLKEELDEMKKLRERGSDIYG